MKAKLIKQYVQKYFTLVLIGGILLSLFLMATVYVLQSKLNDSSIHPIAKKGLFNFSKVDFHKQTHTPLQGEVEFYWKQLLNPNDFKNKETLPKPYYLTLPKSWNNLIVDKKKAGAFGYGTYRFIIKVPKPGQYAIKVKEFESAFQIWINSKFYEGAGKVATSKSEMIPSWRRKEIYFETDNDTIEVLLQISNFHHRKGGASEFMLFGLSDSIRKIKTMRAGIENFLLGILLILALYHLIIYHYRKSEKAILYFSLSCIFILLRLSTSGEKILLEILPFISWGVAIRIEYIALIMITPPLVMFYHYMLPGNIPVWFRKFIFFSSSILVAYVLLLPTHIFTYATIPIIILDYIFIICMTVFIIKSVLKKQKNSIGLAIGSLLLFVVIINDLLLYTSSIQSTYLLPFGLTILLFTQAYLISRNNAVAFVMVKKLSDQLEKHTEQLEEIVLERTRNLQASKNEIEQQKNKIESQAAVLRLANKKLVELDNFKKDMTKMMVHDLKNPLSNIIGLLELPELNDYYKELMLTSGIEMQVLIQNILDVTKYAESKLKVNLEKHNLRQIANLAYMQNKFNINSKSIKFENNIPVDLNFSFDNDLIERVFANIISNATKYKNDNGLIRINTETITKENIEYCKISIYNTGEAIPADKLNTIFESYSQVYEQKGEYKYSTGIGLTFCKMAVEAHNGEIGVLSEVDKGVTFWFTLPL